VLEAHACHFVAELTALELCCTATGWLQASAAIDRTADVQHTRIPHDGKPLNLVQFGTTDSRRPAERGRERGSLMSQQHRTGNDAILNARSGLTAPTSYEKGASVRPYGCEQWLAELEGRRVRPCSHAVDTSLRLPAQYINRVN
jgi:hypothetical protein